MCIRRHYWCKCIGAKVNNKIVPLSHVLQNGDQVEILTSAKQKPNKDWLGYVVTGKAKQRIKYLLKEENISLWVNKVFDY